MVGTVVSHYQIIERVGGGGMGVVYRAEDLRLHRVVALKFLPVDLTGDAAAKERFVQEARAASALHHPNLSTVHDLDQTPDGQLFIVQEYLSGSSLKQLLASRSFRVNEACEVALQVARGLSVMHRSGIIHRDIKPANIMVTADGTVKIVDFGLAKLLTGGTTLTGAGARLGTPAYMAPEQIRGTESTRRTDVWSLGALLYEMLTGRRPFESEFEEGVIYAILHEEPVPASALRTDLPSGIDAVLARAMAKRPDERYRDVDAMAADIESLRRGLPITGLGAAARRLLRPGRSRRVALGVTAALLLAVGLPAALPLLRTWFVRDDRPLIGITSCVDQTGETLPADDLYAISDAVSRYLSSFSRVEVLTQERLHDLAATSGSIRSEGDSLVELITGPAAVEVCRAAGVDAMLTPLISREAEWEYRLIIEVRDPGTNALIGSAVSGPAPRASVMIPLRECVERIAVDIGIPPDEVASTVRRVQSLTTVSFDAYRHFALAKRLRGSFRLGPHAAHIARAISHDSTFGSAYMVQAEMTAGYLNYRQARELLALASRYGVLEEDPEERHRTAMAALTWSDPFGTASIERQIRMQEAFVERHPDDKVALSILGVLYRYRLRIDDAIGVQQRALDLDGRFKPSINELAWIHAYHLHDRAAGLRHANRLEEIDPGSFASTGTRGCIRFMMNDTDHSVYLLQRCYTESNSWNALLMVAYTDALEEDYPAAERQISIQREGAEAPFFAGQTLLFDAHLAHWRGRHEAGRRLIEETLALAETTDNASLRAEAEWLRLWSTLGVSDTQPRGPVPDIWTGASGLLRLCNPYTLYYRGLAALRAGRADSVEAWAARLPSQEFTPRDRAIAGALAALLRRERLLRLDSARAALAVPYTPPDLSWLVPHINSFIQPGADGPRLSLLFSFGSDIEARAWLALGETERAILEYERLVRPEPGRKLWIPPHHHLRLARLYEQTGAPERAVEHYGMFLEFWDRPDDPECREARDRLQVLGLNREPNP